MVVFRGGLAVCDVMVLSGVLGVVLFASRRGVLVCCVRLSVCIGAVR